MRISSWRAIPYFSRTTFFTWSRSARTSDQVHFWSFMKKFPCRSLTCTQPMRYHFSPASSMSLPALSVSIWPRSPVRCSLPQMNSWYSVVRGFLKKLPHENPGGCFSRRSAWRSAGVYDSYAHPSGEISRTVSTTKYRSSHFSALSRYW